VQAPFNILHKWKSASCHNASQILPIYGAKEGAERHAHTAHKIVREKSWSSPLSLSRALGFDRCRAWLVEACLQKELQARKS
jgi:hypothetical protein